MLRLAGGDASMLDGLPTAARRSPATPSRPACTPRIPGRDYRPNARDAHVGAVSRRRAGGDVGRHRHRGECPLRPDAREDRHRGDTREEAVAKLGGALAETRLYGVQTNLPQLRHICAKPLTDHTTSALADIPATGPRIDVLRAGTMTTVQDLRAGSGVAGRYSAVGPDGRPVVPARQHRRRQSGRRTGLECTLQGPRRVLHADGWCA